LGNGVPVASGEPSTSPASPRIARYTTVSLMPGGREVRWSIYLEVGKLAAMNAKTSFGSPTGTDPNELADLLPPRVEYASRLGRIDWTLTLEPGRVSAT